MKKLYIIFLCLCTLLSLVSCNQNKMEEKECYISSPNLIYGDRIYQINTVEKENGQTGTYLTYQNIGNETEATHIGCIDPLCTHDYNVCTAVAYGTSEIVMIPGGKAPKIYFVANIKGDVCIVSLDMETGERKNVCILPELVHEFISKIVVHSPYRKDKRRHQAIDIYYSGVGIIYIPEPEESEMMFQEHLRNLEEKQNNEKTA